MLRGLILLVPASFLLAYTMKMFGIWLAYPVSEALTSLAVIIIFIYLYIKTKKSIEISDNQDLHNS